MKFYKTLALAATLSLLSSQVLADANGGKTCAGCTIVMALVTQLVQVHEITVISGIEQLCGLLPFLQSVACTTFFETYGEQLIDMIEKNYTPDVICNTIEYCNNKTNPTCHVFPLPPSQLIGSNGGRMSQREFEHHVAEAKAKYNFSHVEKFDVCDWTPEICRVAEHKPYFDDDGDMFSTFGQLRGHDWRGRDCDDKSSAIFPGRSDPDVGADNNCNGIFGVDPTTNVPYETEWCDGTGQMGIAILGDSATAHFRIPPSYLIVKNLSLSTFSRLVPNLENELDFPMLSWSTGHSDISQYYPDIEGPVDSIYKRLRENNLCNNNDYQNIGVNGADSSSMVNQLQYLLSRDKNNSPLAQKPLLLFMAMIGNDVCSSKTTSRTTPQEYHDNVLKTIMDLDSRLPKGTKVVLIGLVDGRILYDSMHNLIHPIGMTNNDVTYEAFYDYLNCLEVSPCAGWMNSNEATRDALSATAAAMRDKLPLIIQETRGKLKNLQIFYLGDVLDNAIKEYIGMGGKGSDLIEPADGFHPNQWGQALFAQYLWNSTVQAGIIPPENPHNDKIRARFFPNEVPTATKQRETTATQ
ncbi:hypothetical protein FGO68_gene8762 [Halteria grandinella]|uniref:Saposin B-type domain-containing protein n=1 Tax=Halteria grandinella TaxID=5974 RepID=A0A8J8NRV8_HALGN|nr:hypothetical protein FGO68_gene8762 [Halteria grandinella]